MILEFSVKNFLSFRDRTTFSMIANQSDGLEDNYVVKCGKRILKTCAIYGSNASGKSNLFNILALVVKMISSSNSIDINDKLPVEPFKLDKEFKSKPSEFEIKFIVNEVRYVYGFVLDKDKIYEEYLYYYPNGRESKIFDRTNVKDYSFSQRDEKFLRNIVSKTTDNKFFLSTATNWNYEKTKIPYSFLSTCVNSFNDIEKLRDISCEKYLESEDSVKSMVLDFLKRADFNIVDYKVSKLMMEISEDNLIPKIYNVMFKHKGSDEYINLSEESKGTRLIFYFVLFLVEAFNNQKVIVVDELDRSLHPYLVQYIVGLFNNTEINKSNSQLIFNTHDTNLLDLSILRRDQIWFVEKNNDNGVSDLFSLVDFSVRKSENIEKGYLLGRYGAVPFIKNDINLW